MLLTLASGQFLMTLDSAVMNVSIAAVAKDVDTTVAGIQTSITSASSLVAVVGLIALFSSRRLPTEQPSAAAVVAATA